MSCGHVPGSPAAAAGTEGGSGTAFTGAVFTAAVMTGSSDLGIFMGPSQVGRQLKAGRVLNRDCRPSDGAFAGPAADDPAITDVPNQPGRTGRSGNKPWRPSQPRVCPHLAVRHTFHHQYFNPMGCSVRWHP